MRKDPICGMDVVEKTARHTSSYEGKTYYFCSEMCKRTFDKTPNKYAK
ncbi:MAG: YHS domain-containing protein [Aigarchaeota archaeon]|nr:YHS domain-containing protein [Aigarchaeota archaeon]